MPGAYSHLACRQAYPELDALPCHSFEDAFAAVREGQARYAMIAVDNSIAGRVADVHHLLPRGGLHIVGEQFVRVNHQLLGVPGATLETIKQVESHVHAIGQCRDFLRRHGYRARVVADTAGAAADIAAAGDPTRGAIASRLAAEIYGLRDPEVGHRGRGAQHHPLPGPGTRAAPSRPQGRARSITTFTFRVRNRPAALYKALGGFATNGVNMVKLESYVDGAFTQAEFYADIMGHPQQEQCPPRLRGAALLLAQCRRPGRLSRPTGSASASAEPPWPASTSWSRTLLETATRSDDPAELIDLACAGLTRSGLPLWRLSVGIQTIDPTVRALSYVWLRDQGLSRPDDALPAGPGRRPALSAAARSTRSSATS